MKTRHRNKKFANPAVGFHHSITDHGCVLTTIEHVLVFYPYTFKNSNKNASSLCAKDQLVKNTST